MPEFIAQSLKEDNLKENILSIQVSLNGFSFSIHRDEGRELLALKSMDLKISREQLWARHFEEWLLSEPLLRKGYKEIRVMVCHPRFSLVPDVLAHENVSIETQNILFGAETDEFAETVNTDVNATVVFSLPNSLQTILENRFEHFTLTHPMDRLLNIFCNKPNNTWKTLLYFDEKDLYLLVGSDKDIKLCNAFRINHPNDAIYYVLTALKQFGITPDETQVYLSGKTRFESELKTLLSNYFNNIETIYAQPKTTQKVSEQLLLTQNICLL